MIIFDLDGTLANCEHRRHFVDPNKAIDVHFFEPISVTTEKESGWYWDNDIPWNPNWPAFYDASDKDEPIQPTIDLINLLQSHCKIQIWSGRCESVREKTEQWLDQYISISLLYYSGGYETIKMRPIGDNTPDYILKEMWLNQTCEDQFTFQEQRKKFPIQHNIDFVFTSDPKEVEMWQRRGIFVFNCAQSDKEF